MATVVFATNAHAQWVNSADCKLTSSAEEFRDWVVDNDKFLTKDLEIDLARVNGKLTKCKTAQTDIKERNQLDQCFKRMTTYISVMNPAPTGLLGLVVDPAADPVVAMSNADYYAKYGPAGSTTTAPPERDQLAIPNCLANSDLFALLQNVNLGKSPNGVQAAVNKIKGLCDPTNPDNVIAAPYVTAMTPGIDTPPAVGTDLHGRIIVWYRDASNAISHYVQFTVNADPRTTTPVGAEGRQQASVVNVVAGKGAHVFDWKRNNATGKFEYASDFGNNQICYQCHISGVLEIHPFTSTDTDVGGVSGTLGPNKPTWKAWLDPLNSTWAAEVTKLNKQIRSEYHNPGGPTTSAKGLSVLHGLRADSITMPELKSFPNGLMSVFTLLPSKTTCDAAYNSVAQVASPGEEAKAKCTTCHLVRGSVIFNPWSGTDTSGNELLDGFNFLMVKFVRVGHMPPDLPAYTTLPAWSTPPSGLASGEVKQNTAAPDKRVELATCYKDRLKLEVKKWLKNDCH
jgi:hypothetical protein